ncbi:MAG: alpha-2-macroglobulin family protein, partial [Thermoguttaceae bacterium]|nr:alpha-2-macroglobulin family protein [Thermoguttaceae bacterium]
EVTDQSRRTIVGSGKVYAARRPFQTYVWFDRGYFRVGDTMNLGFHARRLDGKGVSGGAVVKLYRVEYAKTDDGSVKPIETEVYADELRTDEEGKGTAKFVAAEPGQYRVSCVVTSDNGIAQEGGQLVVVRGETSTASAASDYRFNALEIIPDKPEYSVGDVARLQIASSNPNARVLFTARPRGEVTMGEPQFVKLENGLAYVDVPIEVADQPNIFVQATTVFGGKSYSEQKELAVPPEKRVLDVAVEPSVERVKPGEKAAVKLRLADVDGNPVVGQTVVTIYDKSLEYISVGSNVGDVREFFWKWRRGASLSAVDNLSYGAFRNVFDLVYQTRFLDRLQPVGVLGNEFYFGARETEQLELRGNSMDFKSDAKMRSLSTRGMGGMGGMASGGRADNKARDFDDRAKSVDKPMLMLAKSAAVDEYERPTAERQELGAETSAALAEEESAPLVEATVRKNLADLAYWAADLTPGDDGVIEIEVDMPENLTTWKIAAWSVGAGLRVGSGEAEIVTSKDVIIRMQKPRFLTQKDEVVFSANVHNYLDSEKNVQVSLEFPTDDPENSTATLTFMDGVEQTQNVVVPANGEARVDWSVRADGPGVATLVMKALTNEESDAIQETITVKEHGISKQIAVSGVVPPAEKDENATEAKEDDVNVRESTFTLTIPEERRHETTKLTVRFSPTLAGAIFDALPYLVDYPYGCTEQTLNRFLPTVLAQRALQDAGVDLAALQTKKANLNAQELGDAHERAKQWEKRKLIDEPVFDIAKVRQMTAEGVAKLQSMQNGDGGWGWFSGPGEYSTARLTALVARGLQKARECDQQVDANAIERGKQWLLNYEREQTLKIIRGKVWDDEKKKERGSWNMWKDRADSTDAAVYYALSELDV